MKVILRKFSALTLCFIGVAHVQASDIYNYQYTFIDGKVFSGSFAGTLVDGIMVSDISNVSASYDGVALSGSGHLFVASIAYEASSGYHWVQGGAVASFDGKSNNFMFADVVSMASFKYGTDYVTSYCYPVGCVTKLFESHIGALSDPWKIEEGFPIAYDPARWSLIQVAAIPEPSTLALLSAGLLLMAASRRRGSVLPVI